MSSGQHMMWATVPQLLGLPGLPTSDPRCRDFLRARAVVHRQRNGRGGGVEYLTTDLPEATQQALAARATQNHRIVGDALRAGNHHQRAKQVQACADSMARYGVLLDARGAFDPATNPRLDLFQRFEAYHRSRGDLAVWAAIVEFSALWRTGEIEAHPGTRAAYPALPAKTLDKWYRAWRLRGVEALLERRPRKDKGQTQLAADEALHQVFVSALADMHEPTARQVARVIGQELGQDAVPSTGTLRRWLREYKETNKVALLRLKNPDGWRNKYMPAFGSRSEHITQVNEEWQLDSTIADAQQRVDVAFNLRDAQTGEIRRHALIAVIDVFTRRARVLVARTSSANAVKAVTRSAILEWGLPTRVKTDNGKDYTARDYDFALEALQIKHLLCTPFSPDQKPFVERFLGTLLHDLMPHLEGFVGHDVGTRKAIESGRSFAQRFGDKGMDLHMTPEQLQSAINWWLDEYHGRVHSELGCSPNEMAERHVVSMVKADPRALDMLLMLASNNGIRTVGKRGISMDNGWFAAPELVGVMGQQVYCRIDDADLGALHVFRVDGTYVCRALDHSRLGINRAELAAKARHFESADKSALDELRQARRAGRTKKLFAAVATDQDQAAIRASDNVARLPVREIAYTTPAIDSVLTAADSTPVARARQAAREALQVQGDSAPVQQLLDSPRQRYSAWVRLTARMQAQEQISARDAEWLRSYQGSNEFEGWHSMQQGMDPLAEVAGG